MQILIIPIILFNFKNQSNGVKSDWFLLVVYALAKVFEYFGTQVFNLLSIINGYLIKHIVASNLLIFYGLKSKKQEEKYHA